MIKVKEFFDRLPGYSKKMGLIATVVGSVVFLSPYVSRAILGTKEYLLFLGSAVELKKDVHDIKRGQHQLGKILRANMELVEPNEIHVVTFINEREYGVYINGILIKSRLRKSHSGDVYVFIEDGSVGVYKVSWNHDEHKFSYIDFDGVHHFIEYVE